MIDGREPFDKSVNNKERINNKIIILERFQIVEDMITRQVAF